MVVKFTNFVFRSSLSPGHGRICCLSDIADKARKGWHWHDVRLLEHRPRSLVLKRYFITLIIFPSGKLRVMGPQLETVKKAKHFLKKHLLGKLMAKSHSRLTLSEVRVQTISATYDFGVQINLQQLCQYISSQPAPWIDGPDKLMPAWRNYYSAEIFPALALKLLGSSLHANIFASGKCVITGIKYKEDVYLLLHKICKYLKCYK